MAILNQEGSKNNGVITATSKVTGKTFTASKPTSSATKTTTTKTPPITLTNTGNDIVRNVTTNKGTTSNSITNLKATTANNNNNNNTSGGTGSSGSSSPSGATATTDTSTSEDTSYGQYLADYYQKLIDSINKQKEEQDKTYEAKYKQLVQQANDNYNNTVNSITKNNAYTNRWLKQNYGGTSGQGLSNSLRANTNYANNLYSAQQDLNSALLNAETDKYNNQAEATNTYLNNYNNYVTSPISNILSSMSKTSVDDGSYKKYINKLFGA